MALFVRFWGTRGSIPTPGPRTQRYGGNTSCVEIRSEKARIICDGGTGLRELGQELEREANGSPLALHLFFSHPHWDHIQGFPFFLPAYDAANTLYVYGGGHEDHVHGLLSGQMEATYFPVSYGDLGARILPGDFDGKKAKVNDVSIRRFRQHHPGGSAGYVFDAGGARVVYATDNELDLVIQDPSLPEKDPEALRKFPSEVLEPFRGADLVIADGQYGDLEYPKKKGWGHARATTALDLGIQAGAKRLALFHHDPLQSDAEVEDKVRRCAARAKRLGSEIVVFGAREGITLKLP